MFPLPPKLSAPLSFSGGAIAPPFGQLPIELTAKIVTLVARNVVGIHALSQTCRYFHEHTSEQRKQALLDASLEWSEARSKTMPTCEELWRFDSLLRTLGIKCDWLPREHKEPTLMRVIHLVPGGPGFIPRSARLIAQFTGFDSASKTMLGVSMLKSHRERWPGAWVSQQLLDMVAAGAGGQADQDVEFQRLFADLHALRCNGEKQMEQYDALLPRVFALKGDRRVELIVELIKVLDLPPFEENLDAMMSTLSAAIKRDASQFSLGELNRFCEQLPLALGEEVEELFASLLLPRLDAILADWRTAPWGERADLFKELLRVMQFLEDKTDDADDMDRRRAGLLELWRELAPADTPSQLALAIRVLTKAEMIDAFVASLVTKARVQPGLFEQALHLLHSDLRLYRVQQQIENALYRAGLDHRQEACLGLSVNVRALQRSFGKYTDSLVGLCNQAKEIGGSFGEAMLADIAAMMGSNQYTQPEALAALPHKLRMKVLLECIPRRMRSQCGKDGLAAVGSMLESLSTLPPLLRGEAFAWLGERLASWCHASFLPDLANMLLALAEKQVAAQFLGPVLLSMANAVNGMGQDWLDRIHAACNSLPVETRGAWKLACSVKALEFNWSKSRVIQLNELESQARQLPQDQQIVVGQLIEARRADRPDIDDYDYDYDEDEDEDQD